jgi:L-ascorbate metabolism protein UlaG (beta-lactamase superfamily)
VPVSDELTVHVLPARHFSGRGLKRNQTLWASFLFVTPQQKIYYSGDSGYGPHFKAIGDEFGPVDLAIMENGQYDQDWKYIHMMPDETAQAADDLRARAVLPGMQDASCWRNTAGTIRINGWRLPAKEDRGVADADAGRAGLGRR